MIRGGVVLLGEHGIAAIERIRDGRTYHVLPGGQVEDGESPAEAARREAHEELGLLVKIRAAPDPWWLLDGWMATPVVIDEGV
ncbi:NUDIX domain-containing protein [Kribbella sp. VKM Ac-2571]|uniref:NUDIX domain-containing protein n=1 Tax=Kribbella sp. VKM Ac-2571 TaxID=2512222 RepID=UPI0010E7339D|nr:NUDIX domain-containing protein [Kribbella sp. VKM Ac-2571]TDO56213.1 NUDIX domain-containing protein [Kribbella sp. VKM Ac-2571]